MKLKRIAIDTSKHVFTLHGVDEAECPALRRELRRGQVTRLFAKQEPLEVVLEACGSAHHWGRQLSALGHRVKLKSAEQQAELMVLKVRELLVKQRTQLVNALRGHAAEFGFIAAKGVGNAAALAARVAADPEVPAAAREMIAVLGGEIAHLDRRLAEFAGKLAALHRANPMSRLLAEVPGIGPIGALTLALTIDAKAFRSGRHLAAPAFARGRLWIGLTPKEHSTGGKHRLGAVSRQSLPLAKAGGNEWLRQLLVLGATAVIKVAQPGHRHATAWLTGLLARRPRRVAAVALANKMARIVWAMMTTGEAYRQPPAIA